MPKRPVTAATRTKIALLTLISGLLIYVSILYSPTIIYLISSPENFQTFIASYGPEGVGIYILFQMLQVIIAVIPGELIQVAGGYIFGFWPGTFYSMIGITLGSMSAFFLARTLGYPLLWLFFDDTQLERFAFYLNSSRAGVTTFLLFLIPGLPKDMLTYLAGLTPIVPFNFLILAMAARLPGIVISTSVGTNLGSSNYIQAFWWSLLAVAFLLLGLIGRHRFHRRN